MAQEKRGGDECRIVGAEREKGGAVRDSLISRSRLFFCSDTTKASCVVRSATKVRRGRAYIKGDDEAMQQAGASSTGDGGSFLVPKTALVRSPPSHPPSLACQVASSLLPVCCLPT